MFTSIAIIGRPNVGKSTLFNKLTKSRQAIVSDFSGLTKDRNYGYISFGDQKSLIIDTGGIAQDNSILKEDIAEQAWIAAEESNLIIFLLDGSQNLNKEDLDILVRLRKLNKNFITVLNKIDKKSESLVKEDLNKKGLNDIFEISAEHSTNLIDLRAFIKTSLPKEQYQAPEGKKIAVLGRPNAGKSYHPNPQGRVCNDPPPSAPDDPKTLIDRSAHPTTHFPARQAMLMYVNRTVGKFPVEYRYVGRFHQPLG